MEGTFDAINFTYFEKLLKIMGRKSLAIHHLWLCQHYDFNRKTFPQFLFRFNFLLLLEWKREKGTLKMFMFCFKKSNNLPWFNPWTLKRNEKKSLRTKTSTDVNMIKRSWWNLIRRMWFRVVLSTFLCWEFLLIMSRKFFKFSILYFAFSKFDTLYYYFVRHMKSDMPSNSRNLYFYSQTIRRIT